MGTHPIFESDFDCLTDERWRKVEKIRKNQAVWKSQTIALNLLQLNLILSEVALRKENVEKSVERSKKEIVEEIEPSIQLSIEKQGDEKEAKRFIRFALFKTFQEKIAQPISSEIFPSTEQKSSAAERKKSLS